MSLLFLYANVSSKHYKNVFYVSSYILNYSLCSNHNYSWCDLKLIAEFELNQNY